MNVEERKILPQPRLEGSTCECGGTFGRAENGHLLCDACGREVAVERREVNVFTCLRCGHRWMPRKDVSAQGLPKKCSSCRSYDWDKPYAYNKEGKPAPGRERKTRVLKRTNASAEVAP